MHVLQKKAKSKQRKPTTWNFTLNNVEIIKKESIGAKIPHSLLTLRVKNIFFKSVIQVFGKKTTYCR